MSKFDYEAKRLTAERLITKFGADGSFTLKGTKGGFDSFGNATADVADVVVDGIITPLLSYSQSEINGESILSTDNFCYFHSDDSPQINYVTTINGETYRAISIVKLDSVGDVNIYRKIQLRK